VSHNGGAVFVMPRKSTEWADAAAMWITVAGWAAAAAARFGNAWVVTPDAVADAETVLGYAADQPMRRIRGRTRVPVYVRTGAKDALRMRAMRRYQDVGEQSEWRGIDLAFVWQHHDLFHSAGKPLALRRRCPLVAYVHAPQVWEAERWGVRRPGWGALLERYGERPQLLDSDVVAVVSQEVADEVARLGVDEDRVLVSPMAVDAERFSPAVSGDSVRRRFELERHFVVGWTGSFRSFHGLELAIEAFADLHRSLADTRLLLVGDGAERESLEALSRSLGVTNAVVFAGAVAHTQLPSYVAAMDAAVVTARAGQSFHYSPLKMREYLAAGVPVIAPRIGEIPRTVADGLDALLYEPGDRSNFAECMRRIADDRDLGGRLGEAGRQLMLRTGTWAVQLDRMLNFEPFRAAAERLGRGDDR
jgi:glycosyltransferase involved in cell wall biosynthesis